MSEDDPMPPAWLHNPDVQSILDDITPAHSTMSAAEFLTSERIAPLRVPDVVVGDVAPDFDLAVYDFSSGTRVTTGSRFHLQEVAANTPVALVFGSYT
jgi:hypothetical protein